jgi:hypothetical protein
MTTERPKTTIAGSGPTGATGAVDEFNQTPTAGQPREGSASTHNPGAGQWQQAQREREAMERERDKRGGKDSTGRGKAPKDDD